MSTSQEPKEVTILVTWSAQEPHRTWGVPPSQPPPNRVTVPARLLRDPYTLVRWLSAEYGPLVTSWVREAVPGDAHTEPPPTAGGPHLPHSNDDCRSGNCYFECSCQCHSVTGDGPVMAVANPRDLSHEDLVGIVLTVQSALWEQSGEVSPSQDYWDPDKEWDSDVIAYIGEAMDAVGLRPSPVSRLPQDRTHNEIVHNGADCPDDAAHDGFGPWS